MNTKIDSSIALADYKITEPFYAGSRTLVYRGLRLADQIPVVLKKVGLKIKHTESLPPAPCLLSFFGNFVLTSQCSYPILNLHKVINHDIKFLIILVSACHADRKLLLELCNLKTAKLTND